MAAEWRCDVPVALVLFNRPDKTRKTLDAIRRVKPTTLYAIADGPRPNTPEDAARCAATRALIDEIDWDCTVHKAYAEQNLGIKQRVEGGLDWVFANEDAAIVLEDDCVAHPTFFRFCEELLTHYQSEHRVRSITGTNLLGSESASPYSYRFSRYPISWGWATWRRAWQQYDPEMRTWTRALQTEWLAPFLGDVRASEYWAFIFNSESTTPANWDYAWTYAAWQHDGLSIHPNVNLISNIGFGADATHTTEPMDTLANRAVHAMTFPLQHPAQLSRDVAADTRIEENVYSGSLTRMLVRVRQLQLQGRAAHTDKPLL